MIAQYVRSQLEDNGLSDSTIKRRKLDLESYEEWCQENDIEPENAGIDEIDSFLNSLKSDGYSDSSISSAYYSLKGFYDYIDIEIFKSERIAHKDYMGDSSGSHEERKKRTEKEEIKYITESEKDQLKAHAPDPKMKNELLIELMWQTGIRQSEAVLIELNDIDYDEREIDVFAPKTGEWRTVYYQPSLDIALEQYVNGGYRSRFTSAQESPYLFVSRKGPKMNPKSVNIMVRQAAENAGIQEVTGHDKSGPRHKITSHAIRHGHAIQSVKDGIDISFLKEHMGHSDLSTTQIYTELVDSDVKDVYQNKFTA